MTMIFLEIYTGVTWEKMRSEFGKGQIFLVDAINAMR